MRAVGVNALKDRLNEYVRIASAGETVLVTDGDRVVAELGPPRTGRSAEVSDVVVAEASRAGWITPRRNRPDAQPPAPTGNGKLAEVMRELADDRSDR